MTSNELDELAIRKFPLGHPIISMTLQETNTWRPQGPHDTDDYSDSEIVEHGLVGAVLDELPDIPPRTGGCAELLADHSLDGTV